MIPDTVTPITRARYPVPAAPKGWPTLSDVAYRGIAGKVVRAVTAHTEADRVGLLLTFATAFGNAAGRGAHVNLGGDARHYPRLFVVLTGATGTARKGTTWRAIRPIMAIADPRWADDRILGGFNSGEAVVDAAAESEDGRLLIVEEEYGRYVKSCGREGSTQSHITRHAWDGITLETRARAKRAVAKNAFVSVIAHTTTEELGDTITSTQATSGFANRFLFPLVRRSQYLPSGGDLTDDLIAELGREVGAALDRARPIGHRPISRTPAADELWTRLYIAHANEPLRGMTGGIIARGDAQMLRIQTLYAILDGASAIDVHHVEAAAEVWRYCRASAAYIWGDRLGDPHADRIREELQTRGAITRTDVSKLFSRNVDKDVIDRAITKLVDAGFATVTVYQTTVGRGRPTEHISTTEDRR
jgi:hypothetical protein